jgi:hypothetical protein
VTNEEKQRDVRAKFYSSPTVIRHIRARGVPKSDHAFSDMVAAGSSEKLDNEKGLELIACLRQVVFTSHTQQINIMDKSDGKTIASIER